MHSSASLVGVHFLQDKWDSREQSQAIRKRCQREYLAYFRHKLVEILLTPELNLFISRLAAVFPRHHERCLQNPNVFHASIGDSFVRDTFRT